MDNLEFEFSVSNDGDVESVDSLDKVTQTECDDLMKELLKKNKIVLGERSEGTISVVNDVIKLTYRVCTELGEDWNTDVWEDEDDEINSKNL